MAQCGPGSTNINTNDERRRAQETKVRIANYISLEKVQNFSGISLVMGKVEFLAWQSCDICEEADKIEQMMQVDILASYRMTAYAPVF